jgi:hypothetical protein
MLLVIILARKQGHFWLVTWGLLAGLLTGIGAASLPPTGLAQIQAAPEWFAAHALKRKPPITTVQKSDGLRCAAPCGGNWRHQIFFFLRFPDGYNKCP